MKINYFLLVILFFTIWSCATKTQDPIPDPPKPTPPADTAKVTPTLTDFTILPKTLGDPDFTITPPKSNSSGAFTYTSSDVAIAQVNGNTLSVKGSGTVKITATQAAAGNYSAASISTNLAIASKKTIIGKLNTPVFDEVTYYHITAPASNSPAPFEYTSSNDQVAVIGHDTIYLVGTGQTMITAHQNAIAGYSSGGTDTLILTSSLAPITGPVTDADRNTYNAVAIGNQMWLSKNLATTKYQDGSSIPEITDISNTGWGALTTGAQIAYNNDPANAKTYGRLYNWFAIVDKRNVVPQGWHVSTDKEWIVLFAHFGGRENAEPALSGSGSSGFNALYGGVISTPFGRTPSQYTFNGLNTMTKFWFTGEDGRGNILGLVLSAQGAAAKPGYKQDGYAIRCLQNYTVTFKNK